MNSEPRGPFTTAKSEPVVHFQRVKMDRESIFNGEKWTGGSILHSEKGPGVTFAIFLTFRGGVHFQRRKVDRGVHFQRVKMDRGSIFNGEKWTGGQFSTVENGPGGTFFGGSNFNLTPAGYRVCSPTSSATDLGDTAVLSPSDRLCCVRRDRHSWDFRW